MELIKTIAAFLLALGPLILFHELGHGADGLFDRHIGIDAVLVVQIDVVHPEAAQ